MSVRRLFHWTCECGKEVTQVGYGLPKKWIVIDRTFKQPLIKHLCDTCVEKQKEQDERRKRESAENVDERGTAGAEAVADSS